MARFFDAFLRIFLSFVLVIGLMPSLAFATEENTSSSAESDDSAAEAVSTSESDFLYTVNNDEVTITGYEGSDTELVIPSTIEGYPVVAIGDNAFNSLNNDYAFVSIVIPAGVTSIGYAAFSSSESLQTISFANGSKLKSIAGDAFFDCDALATVDFPDGLVSIGDYAFCSCVCLKNVNLPKSVTSVGFRSFGSLARSSTITVATKAQLDLLSGNADCISVDSTTVVLSHEDHRWSSEWSTNALSHWHECLDGCVDLTENSSKGGYANHSGGGATCVAVAACETCGVSYGEVDISSHTGGTEVRDAKEATETEAGYTGDTYCLGCNIKIVEGEIILPTNFTCTISNDRRISLSEEIDRSKVESISFINNQNAPESSVTWDASENQDESVLGWATDNDNDGLYEVTYAGNGVYPSAPAYSRSLFSYFSSLVSLDLSNFDTSNVIDMSDMFYGCESLVSLDLSSFDTSNVISMDGMFAHCLSLETITFGNNWDTSNVTNMSYMFYICESLASLNLSNWDTSNVTDMSYMFQGCDSLVSLNLSSFDTSNVTNMGWMFTECNSLETLNLESFDTSNVTDMSFMFCNCYALDVLNLENFDTANVTNMASMFESCESLTALDLTNFDTSNVNDMESMFNFCESLISITFGTNWNTSNVTNMRVMFQRCEALTTITFGEKWNTSKVTDMSFMFSNCKSLTSLNLSNFDTSNVTDMSYMFCRCYSLDALNLSSFNASKVVTTEWMFNSCKSLEEVTLPNGLTTIGDYAFESCTSLQSITLPESVSSIGEDAFAYCSSLKSVAIPQNVTSIGNRAFNSCPSLESVTVPQSVATFGENAFAELANPSTITVSTKAQLDELSGNTNYISTNRTTVVLLHETHTWATEWSTNGLYHWRECADGCSNLTDDSEKGDYGLHSGASGTCETGEVGACETCGISCSNHVGDFEVRNAKEATEAESGYTGDMYCLGCDTKVVEGEIVAPTTDFVYVIENNEIIITGYKGSDTNLVIPSAIDGYPVVAIGKYAFENQSKIVSAELPEGIKEVGVGAFSFCTSLKNVSVPEGVNSVGTAAFGYCSSLESIVLPNGITSVEDDLFVYCFSLKNVTLPETITSIGYSAFEGCESLESIDIPDSVETIAERAFIGCSSLRSVSVPNGVTSIGTNTFTSCSSLEVVNLPESVVSIGFGAFSRCSSLDKVVIPEGVTSIEDWAFAECLSLESVVLPASVVSFGENVFANIANPSIITVYTQNQFDTLSDNKTYLSTDRTTVVLKERELGSAIISGISSSYTYTGFAIKPSPNVVIDGITLQNGTNYTVSYSNNLNAGKATVTIAGKGSVKGTIKKTFTIKPASISGASLSTTSYTYNKKAKKPTVTVKANVNGSTKTIANKISASNSNVTVSYASGRKNVGTYKVTIKGKGNYTGTKTITFKINPKGTSVSKLTKKSKGFTVKWKKQSTQTTGYQIRYSTSKKMTNAKTVTVKSNKITSKTISKLKKKKTYYVQVRTYKKVGKTNYYSGWSAVKSVKTK